MRRLPLLLALVTAILMARAISQEIVIEPTNGRPQSTNRVSRPPAAESAPAGANKPAANPETQPRATTKKVAKKASSGHKAELKTASVEKKPAPVPETATGDRVVEVDSATEPPRKVIPERPSWAMADTRDARSLQTEIANALARDPKLTSSSIQVSVDDSSVTLQGRAAGPDERLQAQRLAQSYAWNRKLIDHLEVVSKISAQK